MSLLTGIPTKIVKRGGFYGDDDGAVDDPGHYVVRPDWTWDKARPSGVECPYCHGDLLDVEAAYWGRIKWKDDRAVPLMDMAPETHRVLACRPCRQIFTSRKDAAA